MVVDDPEFMSKLIHRCSIARASGTQTVNAEHELVEPVVTTVTDVPCLFFQPGTMTGGLRMFDSANQAILQPQVLFGADADVKVGDIISSTVPGYNEGEYTVMKHYYVYSDVPTGDSVLHHIKVDIESVVLQ